MEKLTFIGDVHGKKDRYLRTVARHERTLCVGDIDFDYSWVDIDPAKHLMIMGNHDNPEKFFKLPNALPGYFGMYQDLFYVAGAFSIDKWARTEGLDWWPEEEMSVVDGNACLDLYEKTKPDFVVSHASPTFIVELIHGRSDFNTRTEQILDAMYRIHKPRIWVFGHHHVRFDMNVGSGKGKPTRFFGLPELGTIEIDFELGKFTW